jgi:hypothetical protein
MQRELGKKINEDEVKSVLKDAIQKVLEIESFAGNE